MDLTCMAHPVPVRFVAGHTISNLDSADCIGSESQRKSANIIVLFLCSLACQRAYGRNFFPIFSTNLGVQARRGSGFEVFVKVLSCEHHHLQRTAMNPL
jgi:hypothetical protein